MARTLLVTHTRANPEVARRAHARFAPADHVELGKWFGPGPPSLGRPADSILAAGERAAIQEQAFSWFRALPATSTSGGAFAGSFVEGDLCLWWWVAPPIWFGDVRDPFAQPLPQLLGNVEAVRRLLESSGFDRLVFSADGPTASRAAMEDLAVHAGIGFEGVGGRIPAKEMALDLVRARAIRYFLHRRRSQGPRVSPRSVRVLLVSHTNAVRTVGGARRDAYLGPLRPELERRGVSAETCYVNAEADGNPRTRSVPPIPDGFLMERSISSRPAKEMPGRLARSLNRWNARAPAVLRSLVWRGLPLHRTFATWIPRLLRRHGPGAFYYAAAFEELFRAWTPGVVVVTNETGYAGRAAIVAARRLRTPCVGVQHGVIGPLHAEYVHAKDSLDPGQPWRVPIPALTVLDGRYYERILTEASAYPTGSTLVTGQMRYAYLQKGRGSPANRPGPIVVTTQPIAGIEAWVGAVLEGLKGLADIVVKVHPLESEEPYRRLTASAGGPISVVRDADLSELLASARALVAWSSTTVVEAALVGCSAVVFNPSGLEDPIPFADLGGAIGASSTDELRAAVADLLAGGLSVQGLERGRAAFLEAFAFGGSEGAASRVADAVLRLG